MKLINRLDSVEGNVWKYIFEFDAIGGGAPRIAEAVLYKYGSFEERTVICCSVQSGCKVGCLFCGTGENFIGQLSLEEIQEQVSFIFNDWSIEPCKVKKLQIMFMSMGEPMDNMNNVGPAIVYLHRSYPNAQLLLSTVGLNNEYAEFCIDWLSTTFDEVGLQFSIHRTTDEARNKLIPYKEKKTLAELVAWGTRWNKDTGRKPYINYVLTDVNSTLADYERLTSLFKSSVFCVTLSVLCNPKKGGQSRDDASQLKEWYNRLQEDGYDVRMFDPSGQSLGAGCGQLWFVQDHLKKYGIYKNIANVTVPTHK